MAYCPQQTEAIATMQRKIEVDEGSLVQNKLPGPTFLRREPTPSKTQGEPSGQRQSLSSIIYDHMKSLRDETMDNLFNVHKRKLDDKAVIGEHVSKHYKQTANGKSTSPSRSWKDRSVGRSSGGQPESGSSDKFTALQAALDAILDDEAEHALEVIGEDAFKGITDLRNSIYKHSSQTAGLSLGGSLSYDSTANLPKVASGHGLAIGPWRSSEIPSVLPPLPQVLDKALEVAAFTHASAGVGHITDLNYERLEWIGDGYIELTATLLISQTFPSFTPGQATHLRETLVKNVTLARFALEYGFDKRARLPDTFMGTGSGHQIREDKRTKVLGDIFEAYVAAIVLSDPKYGLSRATQWLKEIWGMEIVTKIIQEEKTCNPNFKSPIWHLGQDAEAVDQPSIAPLGPKMQLARALGYNGIKINYKDAAPEKKDKNNNLPIFTVGVYIDGWGEDNKQLGIGKAHGKKEAGANAAKNALANKKLMKIYMDKKAVYEAQQKAETEALAKAEES